MRKSFVVGGALFAVFFLIAVCSVDRAFAADAPTQKDKPASAKTSKGKVAKPKVANRKAAKGTLYLADFNTWKIAKVAEPGKRADYDSSLLVRQMFRQALLTAARNELGLIVRDEAVGDRMSSNRSLVVNMGCRNREKDGGVFLAHPGKGELEQIHDLREEPGDDNQVCLAMVVRAEELSRGGFVESLGKLGFSGKPLRRNPQAQVPAEAERLLSEMTFTSQFQALRMLHETMRRDGESDALLGALVRGYANLGWLTENEWLPGPNAFKARALIHSQRMVARGERPAWALYHRAYAFAAASYHALALADLEAAGKADASKTAGDANDLLGRRPAWADLIDAHCRFDMDKVDPTKHESSLRELAELLRLVNVEVANGMTGGSGAIGSVYCSQAAMRAVAALPECYRAHDSLCSLSGVGLGHSSTVGGIVTMGQKLYPRLVVIPDLPPEAKTLISAQAAATSPMGKMLGNEPLDPTEEIQLRGKLIAQLMGIAADKDDEAKDVKTADKKANAPDRGEPSWATLGYLIREESFLQVYRRARFLKRSLGVEADSFLAEIEPLVATHPLRAYIETFVSNPVSEREAVARLWKARTRDFDVLETSVREELALVDSKKAKALTRQMVKNTPAGARQAVLLYDYAYPDQKNRAYRLTAVSPHCPYGRVARIMFDWDKVAGEAGRWEKEATGKQCAVLGVLGMTYTRLGQPKDAQRCLRASLALSPDRETYVVLSNISFLLNKPDEAIAILEEYLTKPDYGLGHAIARSRIANYFMARREWEKALPHAEEAAQAYSASALLCLAQCREGLCQWSEAEAVYKAVAERYQSTSLEWHFFCRRTGQGDAAAATQLAEQFVQRPDIAVELERAKKKGGRWRPAVMDKLYTYHVLAGKHREASEYMEVVAKCSGSASYLLPAAIEADAAGDAPRRDALLKRILERGKSPREAKGKAMIPCLRLTQLIVADLAAGGKGRLDDAAVDRLLRDLPPGSAVAAYCQMVGEYFRLHGQEEKAVNCWKRSLACQPMNDACRTLAGAQLASRGYSPDSYKTLKDAPGAAKDKKAEPQAGSLQL